MKAILRWFGRVLAMAAALALGVALLPYASRLLTAIMPDPNAAAHRTSAILSTKFQQAARLETIRITEEGVMNHDFDIASFVVGNVNVKYAYHANYGVDLSKVEVMVSGREVICILPQPELMFDELEEIEVHRNTFAIGTFTDDDYRELLESERLICRARYASGDSWQKVLDSAKAAMESTVSQWLQQVDSRITITYTFRQDDASVS